MKPIRSIESKSASKSETLVLALIEFARAGITLSNLWKILVGFDRGCVPAVRLDAGRKELDRLEEAALDLAGAAGRIPGALLTRRMRDLEGWAARLSGGEPLSDTVSALFQAKVFLASEGGTCAFDAATLLCSGGPVEPGRLFGVLGTAGEFGVKARGGPDAPFGWEHKTPVLDSYDAAFERWAAARGLSAQERLDALSA